MGPRHLSPPLLFREARASAPCVPLVLRAARLAQRNNTVETPCLSRERPSVSANLIGCVALGKHEKWDLNVTRTEKEAWKEGCSRLPSRFRSLALLHPVCRPGGLGRRPLSQESKL